MTAQYLGDDLYKIWIGHQEFCLSKDEINSIQNFNFETMKETKSVEELENKIEDLQQEIDDLKDKIEELKDKIDDLKDENFKLSKNFTI